MHLTPRTLAMALAACVAGGLVLGIAGMVSPTSAATPPAPASASASASASAPAPAARSATRRAASQPQQAAAPMSAVSIAAMTDGKCRFSLEVAAQNQIATQIALQPAIQSGSSEPAATRATSATQ